MKKISKKKVTKKTGKKSTSEAGIKKKKTAKKGAGDVYSGVRFAPNVGPKRAMEILSETIQKQGRKPPKLDLTKNSPADNFMIEMYSEFARWTTHHLGEFIHEVTNQYPTDYDLPALLSQAKRVFHAMFMDEGEYREKVLAYDSRWKMWPHVKRRGKEEKSDQEEDNEMAGRPATKKKTASKKVAKKVAKKKVGGNKTTSKKATKKTPAKKTSKKKTANVSVTESTKIRAVKDSGEPKMANRKKVKKSVPSAGITAGKLCEKAGCTLKTIDAMIRKGFLEKAS